MAIDANALFLDIDSVYEASALGLMARDVIGEGVTTSGGMAVAERGAGANMSVDIAAGSCWVAGTEDTLQPTYRVSATGTTNVAIGAADATNPRIDLVTVSIRDSQFSGANDDARFLVVAGTPASSPTAPSLPNNTLVLAQVTVAAQVTEITDAAITDVRDLAGVRAAFLVDDSVVTDTLADAAVTTDKLGAAAVTTAKITDGDVTTAKLDDEAVTTAKIDDDAVTEAKLANTTTSNITLANGWANLGGVNQNAQAQLDATGRVYLRGLIEPGSSTNVGFVPSGYRPAARETFAVATTDSGGDLFGASSVSIATDGLIVISSSEAPFSLSGITYRAA